MDFGLHILLFFTKNFKLLHLYIFHCKFGLNFFSLVDDDEVLVVICFLTFVKLLKVFFKQNL